MMMDGSVFIQPSGKLVRTSVGPGTSRAFVPAPLPPDLEWDDQLVSQVSASDRALGQLAALGHVVPNPRLLMASFKRREAVLSSRIEGTRTDVDDLYLFEVAAGSREGSDAQEVVNYLEALDYGIERIGSLPLSRRLLCEMHRILMKGVRGGSRKPGAFRRTQNWIGTVGSAIEDARYVPPPPAEMNDALDSFEAYLNRPSPLPPLVRLAIVHYQFEAIHPFEDGNGRIGRLLVTLMLCMDGLLPGPLLYISDSLERRRAVYYDHLLAVSTASSWKQWISFFLQAVTESALDGRIRAVKLIDLHRSLREKYVNERSTLPLQLLDILFLSPAITMTSLSTQLNVTAKTAQRLINRFVEHGILREVTGHARNRVYLADSIVEVIGSRKLN
jgi:Fic family protein